MSEKNVKKFVDKLLKNYSVNKINSALAIYWMEKSSIDKTEIIEDTELWNRMQIFDLEVEEIIGEFRQFNLNHELKDIENIFELIFDQETKKKKGTIYTPITIIDYLISESIKIFNKVHTIPTICDPACGSGGFLTRAAKLLKENCNISLKDAFNNYIFGFDIDEKAISNAKCMIEMYLLQNNCTLRNLHINLLKEDTLLTDKSDLFKFSGQMDGFDIISTNPPYVKLQNLSSKYRKNLISKYPEITNGNFSTSLLFLIKGYDLLKSNGVLSVITQNNLFTSIAGEKVREYLQKENCIRRIIDFSHNKIFGDISAYTCLIFLNKKKLQNFEFARVTTEISENILEKQQFSTLNNDILNPKKWRLAENKHLSNLRKIESIGIPLGKLTEIRVGFATLKDSVYFVYHENGNCFAKYENKVYQIEEDLTKKAVKIAEVKSESDIKNCNKRIIFPYLKNKAGKFEVIDEDVLKNKYPLTYEYLINFKDVLCNRDKGNKKYPTWYAWGRTQGMTANGPKLLTKTFSSKPLFMMDTSNQLFCNGYSVSMSSRSLFDQSIDLNTLQLILNSKLMEYYTKLTSFQLGGDYQCFQKNFIELFGIPNINEKQKNDLRSMSSNEIDEYLTNIYQIDINNVYEITK